MFSKSKNTNSNVANNRKQRRVIREDIVVAYKGKVGQEEYPVYVELLNISPQGMAFRCNESLRVSTLLNMAFRFRDGNSFFIDGTVIHKMQEIKEGQTGVKGSLQHMFGSEPIFFRYGIHFETLDQSFQTTLIKTMLQNNNKINVA